VDAALIYILFWNEVIACWRRLKLDFTFRKVRTFGPGLERSPQLGFHRGRIKIAAHPQDDVIGMNVSFVPVDQILASDGRDGGIFGLTRIGIVRSIREFGGFARRNFSDLIVAPRNAVVGLLLRQVEFVSAEFGMLQQVSEDFENVVEVTFQAGQADASRIGTATGFHFGGAHFQEVVQLIAGLRFGSTGAPDLAEDIDQSNFGGGFVALIRRECAPSR
jgi:hypothetical protein